MDGNIKAQRTTIGKFISYAEAVINMPEPNLSKGYLEAKNKIITEMWSKLDEANDEIVLGADATDLQSNYFTNSEFDKAFAIYDKVCIRIHSKLEKFEKPPQQLGPVTLQTTQDKSKLKLKPVDIPVFSGDYMKWLSFRSLFDSMVHNNDKIEELEKMHYLKSCVSGDAEGLISQFDVTAQEYQEAYQVITGRYHNEVILVDAHIMDLLSQPNLTSELSDSIKRLMDVTSSNLRALKTLKIDTSTWDPILLLLLVQKLDRATKRLWEQTLKPKVRPTMKEFLEFLSTRFHLLGCQPFKKDPNLLGSSKGQAFSRLMKLESRLEANKELKDEYTQILNEYETLQHTSNIGKLDKTEETSSYYLPHHAVFKPDSTTTKTRIVFDASAKTTNGMSLNDSLMTGPTLQQDLTSILLRWRTHRIVFSADIAKMYRQIWVRMQDRKFQRFLFRENIKNPILEYEHNMVTFGVKSATYQAVKALQHLAKHEQENYPEASEIVLRDFYMDDVMSGADTVDTSTWDPILLLLLVQKLDRATKRLWEQTLKPKVRPTMKEFLEFLSTRFHLLGCQQNFNFSIESKTENSKAKSWRNKKSFENQQSFNNGRSFPPRVHQNFHSASHTRQRKCPFGCGEHHNAPDCESFRKTKLEVRKEFVNGNNLCNNCLRGHAGKCSLKPGCEKCGKGHHTLLHPEQSNPREDNRMAPATAKPQQSGLTSSSGFSLKNHHAHIQQSENHIQPVINTATSECIAWDEPVLLATAIVLIRSERDKNFYPFRALLDQASEASYVTENVLQFLGLKRKSVMASTSGLGGVKTGNIKYVVDFELGSKRNPSFSMKAQAPVTSKISHPLPSTCLQKTDWDHIKDLQLADPDFHTPGKIDLLLGAPIYGYLLLPGLIKVSPTTPIAQNTEFGWILSGATRTSTPVGHNLVNFHLKIELEDQLRKFFEQEEVSKERILTQVKIACEKFFEETVQRDQEGRYIVALPFKKDPNLLGSSKGQAFSRLMKLESRLEANKELKDEYTQILNEYETLQHTSNIGKLDKTEETSSYYLPHHAVFKPDSTTTKTRIVFDASAKTTNGMSLNDSLMTGPTLQQDLTSILLRWRTHRIVFSADIAKMYRQIWVRMQDRKFQRFLFRENIKNPILEYEHNMVTFGVKSATYQAVKALQHLAKHEQENYPEASEIVLRDFYMDDVMSGADTVEQAIKICKDLKELLGKGKFPLRKFISNSTEVLESLPESDRELKLPLEINIDNNIKTLGIRYDPVTDAFQFKVNLEETTTPPTKRSLLSETSKLFDPLGWLAPVIIRAKIMFQQLWQTGLDWKHELPEDIADAWLEFRNELHLLKQIKIDRWIQLGSDVIKFELHGFSDASEKAYSAVIYARVVTRDNLIHVTMLTSKTRVAPIKTITLPRLELCGAVLLANLIGNVQKDLNTNNENTHAWTDSTVVLGWLRTNPAKLKTYVANRVVETHNVLNVGQWHHIEGTKNPADCASRGISPSELKDHKLWWNGPECLHEHRSSWEQNLELPPVTLELKTKVVSTFVITPSDDLDKFVKRYSSFKRLVRATAICLKFIGNSQSTKEARITTLCLTFINNIRNKTQKAKLIITAEDLRKAELRIIRLHQGKEFSQEIHHLAKKKRINKKSKILQLNPFLDSDGCLRVGGRLKESSLSYDRKHPYIIARGNIAKLIIADIHKQTLHGGTRLKMNLVRETYWIINLRRQVKQHILSCVKCCRHRQIMGEQIMANLPQSRVTETPCFTHTGLDYAGPYNIKASNVRSPPTRIKPTVINGEVIKSIPKVPVYEGYIALFVCFATKAVHLEVVSDMTTESFLAAFDRFTDRRGTPKRCYSDNSKTFIGAKNVLDMDQEKSILEYNTVARHLANEGIEWTFIPPRAPHHGGIWESNIRSMKHHLKRVVGNMTLTFKELTTVTSKIEACLNSRPMCPLNDDPDDLTVLTPGHFLIGRPLIARPKGKTIKKTVGARERWNVVQRIQRDFWDVWSHDYLNQLQHRPKWQEQRKNFEEGDIVLLKEDNIAPTKWPLARIIKIYPSPDGNVRSVAIKTHNESGKLIELDRPIVKLCPLPIDENEPDSVDNECDTPETN